MWFICMFAPLTKAIKIVTLKNYLGDVVCPNLSHLNDIPLTCKFIFIKYIKVKKKMIVNNTRGKFEKMHRKYIDRMVRYALKR